MSIIIFYFNPIYFYNKEYFICQQKKLTTEDFINRSNIAHNFYYNYNLTVYINKRTKVKIICPIHGEFETLPSTHMRGLKCLKCAMKNRNMPIRSNINQFIEKANKVHNNKYDYSKFIYNHDKVKGTITCHKHGEFQQTPNTHLRGSGCPICKSSKGEIEIIKFLQMNNIKFIHQKHFDKCRNPNTNSLLIFDFYLTDLNILIEYDGIQHFKNINYFKETLEDIKYKDNIKNKFAAQYNIKLIRISYINYKHIDKILTKLVF